MPTRPPRELLAAYLLPPVLSEHGVELHQPLFGPLPADLVGGIDQVTSCSSKCFALNFQMGNVASCIAIETQCHDPPSQWNGQDAADAIRQ